VLLAIVAVTASLPVQPIDIISAAPPVEGRMNDIKLYQMVVRDVQAGDGYYATAVRLHRENGYPLRPFVTVRLPTLAWLAANLGAIGTQLAIIALAAATAAVWLHAFVDLAPGSNTGRLTVATIAASSLLVCAPFLLTFHESWAGLLMAQSLAIWVLAQRRPHLLPFSVGLGLAAALFRELALAYLVLMAAAAVWDHRRREALAWSAAIAVLAVVLVLHAGCVAAVTLPSDRVSQGWLGLGGWPYFVATARQLMLFDGLPRPLGQALIPMCLFGWLSWNTPVALRVTGLLAGFAIAQMIFARPEHLYWLLLITPLLSAGLVLAIPAVLRLATLAGRTAPQPS